MTTVRGSSCNWEDRIPVIVQCLHSGFCQCCCPLQSVLCLRNLQFALPVVCLLDALCSQCCWFSLRNLQFVCPVQWKCWLSPLHQFALVFLCSLPRSFCPVQFALVFLCSLLWSFCAVCLGLVGLCSLH